MGPAPAGRGSRVRSLSREAVTTLPCLWILGIVGWYLADPLNGYLLVLLAAAPALADLTSGHGARVAVSGVSALFTCLVLGAVRHEPDLGPRVTAACAVMLVTVAGCLATRRRRRLVRELVRTRAAASAAQQVLLRPLPARLGGIAVAARHISATRGASVGGDLYEALDTPHGVRVIIGDVRGHGLAAIGTVAALLGSFREAAHDEPGPAGVLRRLDRALHRHLAERGGGGGGGDGAAGPDSSLAEEFATVLLLELRADGEVVALNCGHPWPYRLAGTSRRVLSVEPPDGGDPLPPLGSFPLPERLPETRLPRLAPGDLLFLHTDGVADARDAAREFFPLPKVLQAAVAEADAHAATAPGAPAATGSGVGRGQADGHTIPAQPAPAGAGAVAPAVLVERVETELLRHAGGRLKDDVALLALRDDRPRVPVRPGRGAEAALPLPRPLETADD